jgi:hypothetical protein
MSLENFQKYLTFNNQKFEKMFFKNVKQGDTKRGKKEEKGQSKRRATTLLWII